MATVEAYSRSRDGLKNLSPHFIVAEFACADGSDVVFVAPRLVQVLEQVRMHFGRPVRVNSGFRTCRHNQAVQGAQYSQHLYGTAADITIPGVAPSAVAAYAETLLPDSGGIGIYQTFTHIDIREQKSRWTG